MPNPSNTSTTSSDGFRRTVLHSVPERRESASRQARQQEEEDAAAAAISNAGSSVQKSELRESNTEMKPKSTADERLGSVEGEKQEITSPRRRPEKISESPGPPPPRRKSSFSYGYRLPDGKLRPPETQEEWNAFYQEYTTGNTVTHSEKFLVSGKAPLNDTMSPLSGSPKMVTEPVLAEEPKVDPAKAADVAYRYSGSNLASAFISPRPSTSRQGGTSSSRLSGDPLFSGGYSRYPPLEHRSSQELQGLTPSTGQSPSDMASPAETPRVSTPGTGRNQDPEIPNIDFAQFSKNRASYQSGMKVSSSRREDELDAEKPQTWGSDAAYQQRDLARLLGQSSAKVMKRIPSHSINHSDAETETDDGAKSAISVATVQQGMADLSGLGGDGAESSKKDVPERPRSTDLEHGSESDDSQSDQVIPAEGGTTQEIPTSQDDAVQIIPYLEPEDRQTTSIPEPESSVLPESEAEAPFSPAYRISHPPTFRATLSELQEEHLGDSPARSHENPASTQPSPKQASHRNFTAPQDRSVRRVDELRHARPRLDSEVSEDPYRIDVSARERAEALRLKEVWEQKGHLTAPKPLPGDARRRAKAM
ncbi:hypothetical protein QFC24_006633 [Naganishia onofrii]|uniref:Uncharacterized protein n=1 Tax=Naganishia onofrii TaxID=1851511 RepID=A0ACC2WYI9_9TREE|nr:hypothetical protein QFC24_006633 [Naganishia onofrii]